MIKHKIFHDLTSMSFQLERVGIIGNLRKITVSSGFVGGVSINRVWLLKVWHSLNWSGYAIKISVPKIWFPLLCCIVRFESRVTGCCNHPCSTYWRDPVVVQLHCKKSSQRYDTSAVWVCFQSYSFLVQFSHRLILKSHFENHSVVILIVPISVVCDSTNTRIGIGFENWN